jgi:hypothetical protein
MKIPLIATPWIKILHDSVWFKNRVPSGLNPVWIIAVPILDLLTHQTKILSWSYSSLDLENIPGQARLWSVALTKLEIFLFDLAEMLIEKCEK